MQLHVQEKLFLRTLRRRRPAPSLSNGPINGLTGEAVSAKMGSKLQGGSEMKCVPWTMRELRLLRTLFEDKASFKEIGTHAGLSRHSISGIKKRMYKLGLVDKAHGERIKQGKRHGPEDQHRILEFLRTQGRMKTAREVALHLQISMGSVSYYRGKYGLRLPEHKWRFSPYYRKRHAHVIHSLRRGLVKKQRRFWDDRRQELFKRFEREARYTVFREYRRCVACGENWPATEDYFYKTGTTKEDRPIFRTRCRGCGSDRKAVLKPMPIPSLNSRVSEQYAMSEA